MQLIDFHTHVYPDPIATKATQSIRDFYGIGHAKMTGTTSELLERGTQSGISRFVILPVALKENHVAHINNFVAEQVSQHPQLTGFGTLHAAMNNAEQEVERIISMDLRGIKMHPDCQAFPIDDERLFCVYEILQDKHLPIMFHMGDSRYNTSHPARLCHIMDMFPHLEVIASHFGGYSMYETAHSLLKNRSCYFDISSSLMFMENGIAEKYIHACGAERFVYGTDYPLWDPTEEVKRFFKLKLTENEFEQIAFKTALHILKEDQKNLPV